MKQKITIFIFLIALCFVFMHPQTAAALSISARVGDQYTEVIGGDRLYFEIEIKYPENPQRKDLRLEYQIIQDGQVLASAKVLRAIETQASFLDYIVVPKSAKSGVSELHVIITDYASLHKEVSATFKILKGTDQLQIYFFILLGAIVFMGILVVVQIFGKRSDIKIRK